MIIHDVDQRSPEWYALRLGRLTSSIVSDMLAVRKDGKEAAGRRNLRVRLALERIVGRNLESTYTSAAMQQGIEREADAQALYEVATGRLIEPVGFIAHDELLAGCSPDGIVNGFEGIVEAKSPLPATHLEYLRTSRIPEDYHRQVLHQLWLTGARWCDWISYGPEFPEPLQLKLVRVERESAQIDAHELAVRQFLREVDDECAAIAALAGAAAVA